MCHLCASVNLTLVPDYLTTVNRPIYVHSALFPDVCGLCTHEHTPKSDAEAVSVGSLCTPHTFMSDLVDFFACLFCQLPTSSSSTSWQTWFIVSPKLQTEHPINKRSQNKSNFTHLLLFLFCEAFVPRLKLCTVLNCS